MSTLDPFKETFVFESTQMLEQVENSIMQDESQGTFSEEGINDIFRSMHTIKGSAAMMGYDQVSSLTHSVEDIFFYIRENRQVQVDFSELTDLVLETVDFVKSEISKLLDEKEPDRDSLYLRNKVLAYLKKLKANGENSEEIKLETPKETLEDTNEAYFQVKFDEDCEMVNVRAFAVLNRIKGVFTLKRTKPGDVLKDSDACEKIMKDGLIIYPDSALEDENKEICKQIMEVPFVESVEYIKKEKEVNKDEGETKTNSRAINLNTNQINVDIRKLDTLMNLVSELVISQSGVIAQFDAMEIDADTDKAIRNLSNVTREIQDAVMSVRMVPVNLVFSRMRRIVRDMERKTGKKIDLIVEGEDTELDKNVIESLADPLMHLLRNAVDHGIEKEDDRIKEGKSPNGKVNLKAKNQGGEVWIEVCDDGKGLDHERILNKAISKGLVSRDDELEVEEIYKLILLPGFSTNEQVTEYSGRGVGMDVAMKGVEKVGGKISIESTLGEGTTFVLKIPLTLSIINGLNYLVGDSRFTIPMDKVNECVTTLDAKVHRNEQDRLFLLVRNNMIPIVESGKYLNIPSKVNDFDSGIFVIIGEELASAYAIFADSLIGESDVVVKPLPKLLTKHKVISGCGIVGDSDISLVLDTTQILNDIKEGEG